MSLGYPNQEGGRSSQGGLFHAFGNIFTGSSISGFRVRQDSPLGMSVLVGGESGVVDDIFLKDNAKATFPVFNPDGQAIQTAVPTANASNPMVDSVVLYIDANVAAVQTVYDNSNKIKIAVVPGTPGANPTAPSNAQILAQIGANSVYTVLGNITLPAGATTVTTAMISDMRVPLGLPNGFVLNSALADGAVDTRTLASSAVTNAKLANKAVKEANIDYSTIKRPAFGLINPTSTGNMSITGLGFKPRAIRFDTFTDRSIGGSSTDTSDGFGYADATTQFTRNSHTTGSNSYMYSSLAHCLSGLHFNSTTPELLGDLVSLDSDGFTLNFSVVGTQGYMFMWTAV